MPDRFENIWDSQVSDSVISDIEDRTGYREHEIFQAHMEIFMEFAGDEPAGEQTQLWLDYIETMINGEMSRDEFFESLGIDPADFDWQAWREAMGY